MISYPLFVLVITTVFMPVVFGGLIFWEMKPGVRRCFAIGIAITALWVVLTWGAIFLSHDEPYPFMARILFVKVAMVALCGLAAAGIAWFRRT